MDLAICPACKQSVLDDDAVTCPFCGAAMDGSSGPTTAAPASAAKPAPKKTPSAKTGSPKPTHPAGAAAATQTTAKASTATAEQDPFAVASKMNQKAIPLRRKPTAKTTYRVVCPMCDTNGFATPAVAGKEVRCPNTQCLMPVFTAPELPKEAPPPPKKSLFTPVNLLIGLFVLCGAGVGVFLAMQPPPQPQRAILPPVADNNTPSTPAETVEPEPTPTPLAPVISLTEITRLAEKSSIEAARQRDNRSKEFCRVLNAEAFAVVGNLTGAQEQLVAFNNLNSGLDFLKITPLSRMAWKHLEQGNREAAEKLAEQAQQFTAKLPQQGPEAVQHAVVLGTLLIALGHHDQARELIEFRETVQDVAQSAARISMIIEDHSYNLQASYQWLPQMELASPLAFAATYGATSRGYEQQALQWINSLQNAERKSMCLAAYAAGLAQKALQQNQPFDPQSLNQATGLTDFDRLRANALALQVLQSGQSQQAAAVQQSVQQAIGNWTAPEAATVPEFRAIYDGVLPTMPADARIRWQTHLLLARSLAQAGQLEPAWQQFVQAQQWTRTLAPSRKAVKAIAENLDRDRLQLQNRLGQTLQLTRDEDKRAAFNQYRKNVRTLEEMADMRYEADTRMLSLTLDYGLASQLLQAYQQATAEPNNTENLVTIVEDSLVPDLVFALKELGQAGPADELAKKWPAQATQKSARQLTAQLQRLVMAEQFNQAVDLYKSQTSLLKRPLLFVRLTSQLAEQATPAKMLEWLIVIPDLLEQELSYRMAANQLTDRGQLREFWKISEHRNMSATSRCSLNLGFMEGISRQPAETATEAPVPAQASVK